MHSDWHRPAVAGVRTVSWPHQKWGTTRFTIQALWHHIVIEACLFLMLLRGRRCLAGVVNSRVKTRPPWGGSFMIHRQCCQMALCKRSRLVIIFPSTRECYTHAGWALRQSSLVHQHDVMLQLCANYWLRAGGRRQSTLAAAYFWSEILITIIDCCVRENKNDKKFDNQIFDYCLTSLVVICATLVNIQTHTDIETAFYLLIWIAQLAELNTVSCSNSGTSTSSSSSSAYYVTWLLVAVY